MSFEEEQVPEDISETKAVDDEDKKEQASDELTTEVIAQNEEE